MICCVTGNRPHKFPFEYSMNSSRYLCYKNQLNKIVSLLIEKGCCHFIVGMAQGADLDFAEAVLEQREILYRNIILEAAIPYPDQAKYWSMEDINRYNTVLGQCDVSSIILPQYTRWCMSKRNEYMVDKSDVVIAVWNGQKEGGTWNTIKYAMRKDKTIEYLMLNSI